MPTSPKDWFPSCYTDDTLLPALRAALGATPAVTAVARWLPEGCSNAEIGKRLKKSEYTVRSQAQHLCGHLSATNREALIAQIVARIWAQACVTGAWPPPGSG